MICIFVLLQIVWGSVSVIIVEQTTCDEMDQEQLDSW